MMAMKQVAVLFFFALPALVMSSLRTTSTMKKSKEIDDDDDDGDDYEHGDVADSLDEDDNADSDFSVHQFIAQDDARDGPSNDGNNAVLRNPQAFDDEETFNSEDTPAEDQDSFVQMKSVNVNGKHVKRGNKGKHSRKKGGDDDDDDDEFEHGDAATSLDDDDSADSDFSVHQFVTSDDARDGPSDGGKAAASQSEVDDFNSEDTPAVDQDSFTQQKVVKHAKTQSSFVQQKSTKYSRKNRGLRHFSKGADDDDDGDEFEHGDASESLDEDDKADSDFSVHQFITPDDARDGPANDAAADRSTSADEDFNSEDTPATDQDD